MWSAYAMELEWRILTGTKVTESLQWIPVLSHYTHFLSRFAYCLPFGASLELCWAKLVTKSFTKAPSVLPVIVESACVYHQMIFLNCIPFAGVALSRQMLAFKALYRCT